MLPDCYDGSRPPSNPHSTPMYLHNPTNPMPAAQGEEGSGASQLTEACRIHSYVSGTSLKVDENPVIHPFISNSNLLPESCVSYTEEE